MKTIIKITKQEAINAWKEQNKHLSIGEDTVVEIEETTLVGSGTTIINPKQSWNPNGFIPLCLQDLDK